MLCVLLSFPLFALYSYYDFAISSSRLYLMIQVLGIALGIVGDHAPRGLSPLIDGMSVILKKPSQFVERLLSALAYLGVKTMKSSNSTEKDVSSYVPTRNPTSPSCNSLSKALASR